MFSVLLPSIITAESNEMYAVVYDEGLRHTPDACNAGLFQRPHIAFSDFSFGWNPDPYTWKED